MKLIAVLLPLLMGLAAFAGGRPGERAARLAPLAALPALWLFLRPGPALELGGLLLGMTLHADDLARPLLLLTGLVGGLAAWFAGAHIDQHRRTFAGFWLLTFAGMNLAVLAGDLAGFYLGYVTVSLAAWGLVVHRRDGEALRAGRVYLAMMLASEALILAGLLQLAAAVGNAAFADLGPLLTASPVHGSVFWLLLAGFGIKLGAAPLHFWAPLADPAAPAPARALLSGLLVKAGLLGWLRFLVPEGFPAATQAVPALVAVGLAGTLAATLYALTQSRPKVILAYSTISQMGLVVAAFSLTLYSPEIRAAVLPVLGLFVLHHGLNKAALFTATGCTPGAGRIRLALLAVPGLSLAGLPLLSGFAAKGLIKDSLPAWSYGLVTLTGLTTALLVIHLLLRARAEAAADPDPARPLHPAWPALVAAGLVVPWWWVLDQGLAVSLGGTALWGALWPVGAAALVALVALAWGRWAGRFRPRLPAGDIALAFEAAARAVERLWARMHPPRPEVDQPDSPSRIAPLIGRTERWLGALPALGAVLLGLAVLIWWLL